MYKKCVMYKYDVYNCTYIHCTCIDTATLGKVLAQSETINLSVSNEHQGYSPLFTIKSSQFLQTTKQLYNLIRISLYNFYLLRNYDRSLQLMQRATAVPAKRAAYYDKVKEMYNDNDIVILVNV